MRLPAAIRSLRHRDYRLFFFGQLVSLCGTWMQSVAQSWLVYRLTGSAALLGAVSFASQIPTLLASPAGGLAADHFDRRRLLLACQTASMLLAFALAALTLTGRITVPWILALAAASGVVNGVDIPTRQAFSVDMVGREDLINAIALNSSVFNGARVIGPAIAGIVVSRIGEGWCFFVNGVSFLAVLAGLFAMRTVSTRATATSLGPLERVREGFVYAAGARPVRALLLLLGVLSLAGTPYSVLMPIFAETILGGGARTLGLLMAASGAGALAGAATLAVRGRLQGLGRFVALSAAGLGVALALFAFSRSFRLSALLMVPVGFCMMSAMASSNTLIQSLIPDSLRGRVMSLYAMMFMGMAPLGALLAGALASRIGAPRTVAAAGALCVVGAIVFARAIPSLRGEARRMLEAQATALETPPATG